MVTGCAHTWRWLERPVYCFGLLGQLTVAYNVRCTDCGERSWQHGTMPDARPILETTTPTTGRS
jgi:hypothetical protein